MVVGILVDMSPFLVVSIMVGMFSHIFCGGHNGGYDEYSQKLWQ